MGQVPHEHVPSYSMYSTHTTFDQFQARQSPIREKVMRSGLFEALHSPVAGSGGTRRVV